jgi:hypothetical protein
MESSKRVVNLPIFAFLEDVLEMAAMFMNITQHCVKTNGPAFEDSGRIFLFHFKIVEFDATDG